MNDKEGVVEYKLDTLTRGVRFAAGIAPKAATRFGLGVALAIEDSSTDSAGELLGIKLSQGASALVSGFGSIVSSVRDEMRSKSRQLGSEDGALSKVPAIVKTRDFVSQAATELHDSWASAGCISVQVDEPQAQESDELAASPAGQISPSAVEATEEMKES